MESISDEEGRIAVDLEAERVHSDDQVIGSAAKTDLSSCETKQVRSYGRRVLIKDLLDAGLVDEGDNLRFVYKGEVFWGRVVGNGQLEVNGKLFPNPSRAAQAFVRGGINGWYCWLYKDSDGKWRPIEELRKRYRERNEEESHALNEPVVV